MSHHVQQVIGLQGQIIQVPSQMMVSTTSTGAPQQQIINQIVAGQSMQHGSISSNSPDINPGQSSGVSSTSNTPQPNRTLVNQSVPPPSPVPTMSDASPSVITKQRLCELVREVDPNEQLDDDVEELLMLIADDFIESITNASCKLAKHRGSRSLDVKDVQTYLEKNWQMWIPGFGTEEMRPYKRAPTTEAHKQRLTLLKKALKKY